MVFRSTILLGSLLNFFGLDKAVDPPSEVMLKVTKKFGQAIYYCQYESGFSDDVVNKIRHFWHEDYEGTPLEMACVFRCVVRRLKLVDHKGNLQDAHIQAFLQANGADNATAKRLLDVVTKECSHNNARSKMADVPEDCLKAMVMANCLRTGVLEMRIEPSNYMQHKTPT